MKKARRFWNYLDMTTNTIIFLSIIVVTYYVCESLERYVYRYTVFPLVAIICVFALGVITGKSLEKTSKVKPIGFFSKKMAAARMKKNAFIFKDDEETYVPRKEVIEEIKSGRINHVKQYENSEFNEEDFKDIYNINIDDILDDQMNDKENNE